MFLKHTVIDQVHKQVCIYNSVQKALFKVLKNWKRVNCSPAGIVMHNLGHQLSLGGAAQVELRVYSRGKQPSCSQ